MRQKVRKALALISLLLFPITMNYLSPYVADRRCIAGRG